MHTYLKKSAKLELLLYQRGVSCSFLSFSRKSRRTILKLLADGLTNQTSAERLMLSVRTIQGHRNNLYHKLKGHNLAELNECISQIDLS